MDSFGSHCSAASNFLSSQTHYYSVPFGLTAEGDCRSLGLGISQLRASTRLCARERPAFRGHLSTFPPHALWLQHQDSQQGYRLADIWLEMRCHPGFLHPFPNSRGSPGACPLSWLGEEQGAKAVTACKPHHPSKPKDNDNVLPLS